MLSQADHSILTEKGGRTVLKTTLSGRLFVAMAAAIAFYVLLGLLAGWSDLRRELATLAPSVILALVLLSVCNYVLRWLRWELYRQRMAIRMPLRESLALFFATFAMVITPGKLGEVYKAAYLHEKRAIPWSTSLPILLAERIFDFLAVLLLAGLGLLAWQGPLASLRLSLLVAGILPLLLVGLRWRRAQSWLLAQARRVPALQRRASALETAWRRLDSLTGPGLTAVALALSVLAWAAECGSLWLVLRALGAPLPTLEATFVYAAATLAGSLVFLPGGLGGAEGTIILLLTARGMATAIAISAALIVRLATLWLAVALGLTVFALARRLLLSPGEAAAAPPDPAADMPRTAPARTVSDSSR